MAILFAVPKGTEPAVCQAASCQKQIYWVLTARGKRMPVDVDTPNGKTPTRSEPGQGEPHWAVCPGSGGVQKGESVSDILKDLARLGSVHREAAKAMGGGSGASVKCQKCGRKWGITLEDSARYLARGWPICCGETMTFVPGRSR